MSELLEQLINEQNAFNETKALHFGTEQELEEIKKKKSMEWRLANLEEEVEKLKPVKSDMILVPTKAQIKRFAKRFR